MVMACISITSPIKNSEFNVSEFYFIGSDREADGWTEETDTREHTEGRSELFSCHFAVS